MPVDFDFLLNRWVPLTLNLGRLLDVRFVPDHPVQTTPIGWAMSRVLELANAGDVAGRDTHFMRLAFLAKHLEEIEQSDPRMLTIFRRKLTDANMGNFFGTRFEVSMAASLIRSRAVFQRCSKGGPDFVLGGGFAGTGVECVSAHVPDPVGGPHVLDKLHSVVSAKSRKDYALQVNALAVDVTNLQAVGIDQGQGVLISPQYANELASISAGSGFGSLLFFWLQTELTDGSVTGIRSRFARADSPHADALLLAFIEAHFGGRADHPAAWRVPYMP